MKEKETIDTELSFSRAAELAGKARQTIHHWEKIGKITVNREIEGEPKIAMSELMRVTDGKLPGLIDSSANEDDEVGRSESVSSKKSYEPKAPALETELALAIQKIGFLESQLNDERSRNEQAIDNLKSAHANELNRMLPFKNLLEDQRAQERQDREALIGATADLAKRDERIRTLEAELEKSRVEIKEANTFIDQLEDLIDRVNEGRWFGKFEKPTRMQQELKTAA